MCWDPFLPPLGAATGRGQQETGLRPGEVRWPARGLRRRDTCFAELASAMASSQTPHKRKVRRLEDELAVTRPLRAGHTSPSTYVRLGPGSLSLQENAVWRPDRDTDALVSGNWREEPAGWSQSPRVRQAGPGEGGRSGPGPGTAVTQLAAQKWPWGAPAQSRGGCGPGATVRAGTGGCVPSPGAQRSGGPARAPHVAAARSSAHGRRLPREKRVRWERSRPHVRTELRGARATSGLL